MSETATEFGVLSPIESPRPASSPKKSKKKKRRESGSGSGSAADNITPISPFTSPTSVFGFPLEVEDVCGAGADRELLGVPDLWTGDSGVVVQVETPTEGRVSPPPTAAAASSSSPHRQRQQNNLPLHSYLERCDWKKLKRALAKLTASNSSNSPATELLLCEAFSVTDPMTGELPIHTAAWKAPTKLVLAMLDLLPLKHRKRFLLAIDDDGNTPLHLACANVDERVEYSVIKNVFLLAPEAVELKNVNGDTPLHLLVASRAFRKSSNVVVEAAAEEAIASLLLMTPSAASSASSQNNAGATLLHVAVCAGGHERVLMKLLQLAPGAVRVPDNHGLLPIHFVAAFGETPWPVAAEIIRLCPDCIYSQCETGDTPLHLLMSNAHNFLETEDSVDRNTMKLAELLIGGAAGGGGSGGGGEEGSSSGASSEEERRRAVSPVLIRNNEDVNPLHAAALFNTPVQLTRLLMESPAGPLAATERTAFGRRGSTALHLACASKKVSRSVANVETLTTPEACATADGSGKTPLAVASQNRKVTKKIVKGLVRTHPEAAAWTAAKGQKLPLHLAVASKKSKLSVVKALIKAYPEGVRVATGQGGNTPLHEACKSRAPTAVIELLIDKYPEALAMENSSHELPIDRARAEGASREILTLLQGSSFVMEHIEERFLPSF